MYILRKDIPLRSTNVRIVLKFIVRSAIVNKISNQGKKLKQLVELR